MGAQVSRLAAALEGHERVAVDTAPLIYFLGGYAPRDRVGEVLLSLAAGGRIELVASVLTEAELLVGALKAGRGVEAAAIGQLFDGPVVRAAPVTREAGRAAADLRARHGLGMVDAIVAATAFEEGCTALVGNDDAFRRLAGSLAYLHVDDLV